MLKYHRIEAAIDQSREGAREKEEQEEEVANPQKAQLAKGRANIELSRVAKVGDIFTQVNSSSQIVVA